MDILHWKFHIIIMCVFVGILRAYCAGKSAFGTSNVSDWIISGGQVKRSTHETTSKYQNEYF